MKRRLLQTPVVYCCVLIIIAYKLRECNPSVWFISSMIIAGIRNHKVQLRTVFRMSVCIAEYNIYQHGSVGEGVGRRGVVGD